MNLSSIAICTGTWYIYFNLGRVTISLPASMSLSPGLLCANQVSVSVSKAHKSFDTRNKKDDNSGFPSPFEHLLRVSVVHLYFRSMMTASLREVHTCLSRSHGPYFRLSQFQDLIPFKYAINGFYLVSNLQCQCPIL